MKLKPLGDRVVVQPTPKEEMTKAGIILPDTADNQKKAEGEIVAVGSGEKISKMNVSVGQKVVFRQYGGDEVTIDGTEYKILSDEDLLAIVE